MKKGPNNEIPECTVFEKITKIPRAAGCEVIRIAITLYVLLGEPEVPAWAKMSIVVALSYFISPIDAIPDFLPGGYLDDLAAMTLLLGQLDLFIDITVKERVTQLLPQYCRSS